LGLCGAQTWVPDAWPGSYPMPPLPAEVFARRLDERYTRYDWQVNDVPLNRLDSHATARARWLMGEEQRAWCLGVPLQMPRPGAPCMAEGDAIGLSAAQAPFCRAAFPGQEPAHWAHDLRAFYRRAIARRQHPPALRTGTFQRLQARAGVYAFVRTLPGPWAVVIVNPQPRAVTWDVDLRGLVALEMSFADVWHQAQHVGTQQRWQGRALPAREAVVLVGVEDGAVH
jgi:glycosidase